MQPIALDDVLGRDRYGAHREAIRRRLIEHKRARRVVLGDLLTLVFEDRATVWYQTQEMLWVEQVTDLDAVRAELAVYNQLLPGPGELAATLFIEVPAERDLPGELTRLLGIDEHLLLGVDGAPSVRARFEAGRQTREKLSAVQYVRFPLAAAQRSALGAGGAITLSADHPNYRAEVAVAEAVRASLAADVDGGPATERALQSVRDAH